MKRHRLVATTVVSSTDSGGPDAVANEMQTAPEMPRRARGPVREAGFVPTSVSSRTHTLILTGELDRGSAYAFEAEIERLCEEGVTSITLDLRELTYIDPIGVAVIALRCRLCQRRGYGFDLIPGGRMIQRAFEQAGVVGLLPFKDQYVLAGEDAAEDQGAGDAGIEIGSLLTVASVGGGDR